jgi:hypothetical protein
MSSHVATMISLNTVTNNANYATAIAFVDVDATGSVAHSLMAF